MGKEEKNRGKTGQREGGPIAVANLRTTEASSARLVAARQAGRQASKQASKRDSWGFRSLERTSSI